MTELIVQVSGADEDGYIIFYDGEGLGDTTGYSSSSKVIIGRDSLNNLEDHFGWVHLKNLTIAQGSTINSAKLYVYHHSSAGFDQSADPSEGMTVKAEDTDDAARPADYAAVAGWTLTSASATVSSFIDADEGMEGPNEEFNNAWYPTHADPTAGLEIKTILQELVDRSGWSSGSNINLKLTPAAHDGSLDWSISWKDYDTSTSLAPKVVINYTAAAAGATTSPAFLLFLDM